MTDTRVSSSDRTPEPFDDGTARSASAAVPPRAPVVRAARTPRNPWLTTIFVLWVAFVGIAVILALVASGQRGPDAYGGDPSPGLDLAAWYCFSIGIIFLVLWITVKAVLWKPPAGPTA